MPEPDYRRQWTHDAAKLLCGKRIVSVQYMDDDERGQLDWHQSALVIQLDDGTLIWASRDDEGNGPGALFTSNDDLPIIPVI